MTSDHYAAPILVWQMGKVGSTSIHMALARAGLPVAPIHYLNPERLDDIRREYAERSLEVPAYVGEAARLRDLICDETVELRIVSAVRDPVARNLAGLFEMWADYPPQCNDTQDLAQLAEWFVMNFDYSVLDWFDRELGQVLGIDVFSHPFDQGRRRLEVDLGRVNLLVLRCEDSDALKMEALNRFLGRTDIVLKRMNVSRDKPNGALWEAMRRSAKVSAILADIVYGSRLVQHFYTPAEIAAFRERWLPRHGPTYLEVDE